MASHLLNCVLPFLAPDKPPALSREEASSLPPPDLLRRFITSPPQDSQLRSDLAAQVASASAPDAARSLVSEAFRLASDACVVDRDKEVLAACAAVVEAVVARGFSGGRTSHHPPQQSQEHAYPPSPQPQRVTGSYASKLGNSGSGGAIHADFNAGGGGHAGRPTPQQQHQGSHPQDVTADAYFFPSEESFRELVKFIDSAKKTLDICVFTITDDAIAKAIISAHRRHVQVRIISDDEQAKSLGSDVYRLSSDEGIPVKLDNDPKIHMHNKFAIVDAARVLTGSYNWTKGARFQNRENIVLTNHTKLVEAFGAEFEKLWNTFAQLR